MKRMLVGFSVALACSLGFGCAKSVRDEPAQELAMEFDEPVAPVEDRLVPADEPADLPTITAADASPGDPDASVLPPQAAPAEAPTPAPAIAAAPVPPSPAMFAAPVAASSATASSSVPPAPAPSPAPAVAAPRPAPAAAVMSRAIAPRTVALQARPAPVTTAAAQTPVKAGASGGSVFVAGDAFSLEQAFADATLEKLGGAGSFTIVATQREAAKLTEKGAKPNVKTAVRQFQQAGGRFYLCDRDLAAAKLAPKDVLPGVKVERALTKQEQQATGAVAAQDAELRRVRRACS